MATTSSFKQECPSCDHPVPIRDRNLIGRKIDCPKCKYRFVVEDPGDEDEEEPGKGKTSAVTAKKPAKAGAGKKPGRRRDEGEDEDEDEREKPQKKAKGNSTVLILGIGLGVVALVLLGVGGYFLFSGGESTPPTSSVVSKTTPPGPPPSPPPNTTGEGGQAQAPDTKKEEPVQTDLNYLTNLVPNDTDAIVDLRVDKVRGSGLGKELFSPGTGVFISNQFEQKFQVPVESVTRFIFAASANQDWVFGILHCNKILDLEGLQGTLGLEKGPKSPIQGLEYYLVKGDLDPFTNFFLRNNRTKPLGLYKYDSQTLVLAELDPLEKFLEVKAKPKFISEAPAAPAATSPSTPMYGGGGYPGGGYPGGSSMGGGPGRGGPSMAVSGGMGPAPTPGSMGPAPTPGGMGPGGPSPGGTSSTSEAPPSLWMTVKQSLKSMLDRGEEAKPVAMINVAVDLSGFKPMANLLLAQIKAGSESELSDLPDGIKEIKAAGVAIQAIKVDRITGLAAMEFTQEENAKEVEKWGNTFLASKVENINQLLGTTIQVGNTQTAMAGTSPYQGYGPSSGSPMGPAPSPGSMSGAPPGMMRPGIGSGSSGPPPGMMAPGIGSGSSGPPPGMMAPGIGSGSSTPGGRGGMYGSSGYSGSSSYPSYGGGSGSMAPSGSGSAMGGTSPDTPSSTYSLTAKDKVLVLAIDVALNRKAFDLITLGLQHGMVQVKGKGEMVGNKLRIHELAAALRNYSQKNSAFPRGTLDRPTTAERGGRPWAPNQRLSWLAEILRHLPQYSNQYGQQTGAYPLGLDVSRSWNDKENLLAAQTLVPQFLGNQSPQTQWWVQFPGMPVSVAATHFVGVAGIGLDAAEGAPPNMLGVFGYDRVTRATDIVDGLENTIAVLQVPPEFNSPWLAGGGATVRGIPETESFKPFVCADYKGKRGTFAIMANGDVRFIPETISDPDFKALCTIGGGEKIDADRLTELVKPEKPRPPVAAKPNVPGVNKPGEVPAPKPAPPVEGPPKP